MIQKYETLSMHAWPALETCLYDDWMLRFADGITKRANSINPLTHSTLDLETKVDYCESQYQKQNLPTVYKLTPNNESTQLDALLAQRGYRIIDTTSLQTLTITQAQEVADNIMLTHTYNDHWLRTFMQLSHKSPTLFENYKKIFMKLQHKTCYLLLTYGNQTIGCGLGVIEEHYIGIFDIVVSEKYRKQGHGKHIIEAILSWGHINHANTAYLQVVTANTSALRLYGRLGFQERYRYWYRVK